MAFESLTDKLQNVFKSLRGKGRLTENDVKAAMKEVKMALLEADVNFRVVKQFVKSVEERAIGADVMNALCCLFSEVSGQSLQRKSQPCGNCLRRMSLRLRPLYPERWCELCVSHRDS